MNINKCPPFVGKVRTRAEAFIGRIRTRAAPVEPFVGKTRTRALFALPSFSLPTLPKRRGRAPSYIPDPWSDLEWEEHPAARLVVTNNPAGMTLEEIGAVMGITRERVRQIEHSALAKLMNSTGSDVTWIGGSTLAIPECPKCGEAFIRRTGRQALCRNCELKRKRKRHIPPEYAHFAINQ